MTLEEENKKLREALSYATNAITFIPIFCMVPTSYFPRIDKILTRIDELTPKPLP